MSKKSALRGRGATLLRLLPMVLVVLVAAMHAAASEGLNLVENHGFDGPVEAGRPVGWTIVPEKSEVSRVVIDTTNSTTGGRSIRIDHTQPVYTRLDQLHIKVKPNTDYLFRFDCNVQNIKEAAGSRGASLFIGNNGQLMSLHARIQAQSHPQVPGWHTYSQVINTSRNTELGICLVLHNATGTVWFDNVQIMELTPTLAQSLANERARKIIAPDIKTVRKLASELNDTAVLAELKSIEEAMASQEFAEVTDYREGLPYYAMQRQIYSLYGRLLHSKHPQKRWIVSSVSPFVRFSYLQDTPTGIDGAIQITGACNDVEQFALNFTNVTSEAMTVQSRIPPGVELTARRVVEVRSSIGMIDDALRKIYPDAQGNYSFEIPAGMTRQIWFEIKLDAQPGRKDFQLEFRNGSDVHVQPVEVTVADITYPQSMPLTTYSYVWAYARHVIAGRTNQVALDLKKHHANAWMNRRGQALPHPVVENGKLAPEKMQWEFIDRNLQDFPFRHTFVFLIHENYLKYGPEVFKDWVKEIVKQFKARGLGYDQLLITCFDEPFSPEVARIVQINKLIREADPHVRTYSNFHDVLSKADIKLLAESVSVIAPEYNQLTEENIRIIKAAGAELWCYRVQERSVLPADVRLAFWKLHKAGVKGYSVWAYVEDKDGWNMPDGASCYNMIYDGDPEELTPSKRWEAWREGIEDFALLDQLKAKSPRVYSEVMTQYNADNLDAMRQRVIQTLASTP